MTRPQPPPWTLGAPDLDARLWGGAGLGLDPAALHEIKPAGDGGACAATNRAAALTFALQLAVRRIDAAHSPLHPRREAPHGPALIWCWSAATARETGHLHGQGLVDLGLDPAAILLVEAPRTADVLWAIEEAVKSRASPLVIGVLAEVDLTAARRLSLAAKAHATPCLLVTHAPTCVTPATSTRWRIAATAGAPHPMDARAPGPARARVLLERCRVNPAAAQSSPVLLEWSHDAHCFHLAAPLAHRAAGPPAHAAPRPILNLTRRRSP